MNSNRPCNCSRSQIETSLLPHPLMKSTMYNNSKYNNASKLTACYGIIMFQPKFLKLLYITTLGTAMLYTKFEPLYNCLNQF